MCANGVGLLADAPCVWSLGRRTICNCGIVPAAHEPAQLLDPDISAPLIRDVEVVARELSTRVGAEKRFHAAVACRGIFLVPVGYDELTVVPECDSLSLCEIPEVAIGWFGNIVVTVVERHTTTIGAFVVIRTSAPGIVRRHRLLRVVGRVRRRTPVVPIGADFGVDEESVEESEPICQRVVIR